MPLVEAESCRGDFTDQSHTTHLNIYFSTDKLTSKPPPNSTNTVTKTNTVTVVAPTPTVYGQCQSNNVVGAANGNQGIYQPGYATYNGVSINQVAITDPTACCAQCQQTVGCVGFAQYPNGACYYFTVAAGSCDGSNTFGDQFVTKSSVAAGAGYIIGNGQCGRFANAGSTS